jgi:hypothetical protein
MISDQNTRNNKWQIGKDFEYDNRKNFRAALGMTI